MLCEHFPRSLHASLNPWFDQVIGSLCYSGSHMPDILSDVGILMFTAASLTDNTSDGTNYSRIVYGEFGRHNIYLGTANSTPGKLRRQYRWALSSRVRNLKDLRDPTKLVLCKFKSGNEGGSTSGSTAHQVRASQRLILSFRCKCVQYILFFCC